MAQITLGNQPHFPERPDLGERALEHTHSLQAKLEERSQTPEEGRNLTKHLVVLAQPLADVAGQPVHREQGSEIQSQEVVAQPRVRLNQPLGLAFSKSDVALFPAVGAFQGFPPPPLPHSLPPPI